MILTIAIPTFNNASTIEETLKSCINQNFDDTFEVLVVNNNSTDNTEEILSKYDKEIRIIKNDETVSMYKNHNICLQKAKGDYVIFCHSDDQLLPDALKKYNDILKKRNYPERYVLWGRSMFRDYYTTWQKGGYQLNEIAAGIRSLDVFSPGGLTPSGTCYSRESLINTNGFIEVQTILAYSDSVTMWKLAVNSFEFEMSDRLFFVRQNASTASGAGYNKKNKKESLIDAIQCLKNDISSHEFGGILEYFKQSNNLSPKLANILILFGFLDKSSLRGRFLKRLIKDPFLLRHKDVIRILLP